MILKHQCTKFEFAIQSIHLYVPPPREEQQQQKMHHRAQRVIYIKINRLNK